MAVTKNTRPLVLVEWRDAVGGNKAGWRQLDDMVPRTDIVQSVGWLIHKDRKIVTVVPHLSGTQGDGELSVPRAWIQKLVVLKETSEAP